MFDPPSLPKPKDQPHPTSTQPHKSSNNPPTKTEKSAKGHGLMKTQTRQETKPRKRWKAQGMLLWLRNTTGGYEKGVSPILLPDIPRDIRQRHNYLVRRITADCHQPHFCSEQPPCWFPRSNEREKAERSPSWLFLVPATVLCSLSWCRSLSRHDTFCLRSGDFSQSS